MNKTSLPKEWHIETLQQLKEVVLAVDKLIKNPAIIILDGDVGAGKTTFVKCFDQYVISFDGKSVISPTYSLINSTDRMIHADFYRLKDKEDISSLELPLYLNESIEYIFIEWGKEYIDMIIDEIGCNYNYYLLSFLLESKEIDSKKSEKRSLSLTEFNSELFY